MSKVKSHLVFCKASDDGTIDIVRILHQKMDIENRLKEK
jgi:toxin ParE1/3/4